MAKTSMMLLFVVAAALGCGVVCAATQAVADSPESACEALMSADFSKIPDAPTQIIRAAVVAASDDSPAHCAALGYVTPNVGIELRLPVSGWNGKFLHVGCGGWCGGLLAELPFWPQRANACDIALRRGYACIANDSGHKGSDLKWAYNNPQAEIDYAYRATHVAAIAGKAVTTHYYSKTPSYSYLIGCSGGGREGMVAAQRFPWDFDGIVSIAPAISVTGGVMRLLWNDAATLGKDGRPILNRADLQRVHDAAVAQCDLDDGVRDGVIGDPRNCKFDPGALLCKRGQGSACLNDAQVAAVKKIYAGPTTSTGEKIYTSGAVPGSELGWNVSSDLANLWEAELFRYMAFVPDPGPAWKASDFDFDRDYQRLGMMESLLGATNPDLRKFKAAGGKLIAVSGWTDSLQDGQNLIDYYETVEKTMGGRPATEDFFRLFMLPGVDHCTGGAGADTVDYLSYLEAWVEKGAAPDKIISAHLKPGSAMFFPAQPEFPLDPATVEFTRPVYPYPARAIYQGSGDPKDAANFGPAAPTVR